MSRILTSADANMQVTIAELFDAPFDVNQWEADRAWDFEPHTIAEGSMSLEGVLSRAMIPNPIVLTVTLQASSNCWDTFQEIREMSVNGYNSYEVSMQIREKHAKKGVELIRGFIENIAPGISSGRRNEPFPVRFQFERAISLDA